MNPFEFVDIGSTDVEVTRLGLGGAPLVYAHDTSGSQGSMTGQGMMGQGGMMQGGQGGQMGQGGMMNMMGQMSQMVATCNQMMQKMMENHDAQKPNNPLPGQGATQ